MKFEKIRKMGDFWAVCVHYERKLHKKYVFIMVPDDVFQRSKYDQEKIIEGILANEYPEDMEACYQVAYRRLFQAGKFEYIEGEDLYSLIQRAKNEFGMNSIELYCAHVVGRVEKYMGFRGGATQNPPPIDDIGGRFAEGFLAGLMYNEMALKEALEDHAVRGRRTKEAASRGGERRHEESEKKYRKLYPEILIRIDKGEKISKVAADIVFRENLEIKPRSLEKGFRRWQAQKK